jgi:hypothetical protein
MMAPTSSNTKSHKGKIEIKKVEEKNKRHVTFTKRKLGLFNKVTELSILCQVDTALIITSPNGKHYVCGYPNPDTVVQRFLGAPKQHVVSNQQQQEEESIEALRLQYEATHNQLKQEKKLLKEITEAQKINPSFPSWWNLSIDDMDLESLQNFKTCLENLRLNLVGARETKKYFHAEPTPNQIANLPWPQLQGEYNASIPLATVPQMPQLSNLPYLGECSSTGIQVPPHNLNGGGTSSMVPNLGFGYY